MKVVLSADSHEEKERGHERGISSPTGLLIINADDWGRDSATTDRILECVLQGAVSSASAMVFMADSERAAALALEHHVDVGLHLNLTTPFSGPEVPAELMHHQERLVRFLTWNRLAQVLFHPGLARSFRYVVTAQIEEFLRLFGVAPVRVDGHHHMHLCANVLLAGLLPGGTIARRSFSFQPGEKSVPNRLYRGAIVHALTRRHRLTDYFFSLAPIEPVERLRRIAGLSRHAVVELETHPVNPDEYRFLMAGDIYRLSECLELAHGFALPPSHRTAFLRDARQVL